MNTKQKIVVQLSDDGNKTWLITRQLAKLGFNYFDKESHDVDSFDDVEVEDGQLTIEIDLTFGTNSTRLVGLFETMKMVGVIKNDVFESMPLTEVKEEV